MNFLEKILMTLLLSIAGLHLSAQTGSLDSIVWLTYIDSSYSLQYPENWELNTSGMMNTELVVMSPQTDETDAFKENVNLMLQDLTGHDLSLPLYIELSVNQIGNYILESNILYNEPQRAKDRDYQKLIYTGRQGKLQLTFEQYVWVENEKAYILTLTCEIDQYDAYKTIGEEILDRFTLLEN